MADIFISYSSEEKIIVSKIAKLLEAKGWSVWWDGYISHGQRFDNVIEQELNKASCVVVIWTQRSVVSEWVKTEATKAMAQEKLVPLMLEEVSIPLSFSRVEAAMLTDWDGESTHTELDLLYHSIENIISNKTGKPASGSRPPDLTDTILKSRGRKPVLIHGTIAAVGFIISFLSLYYYLNFIQGKVAEEVSQRMFYLLLIVFGISASAVVFGLMNTYAAIKGEKQNVKFRMVGPGVGVLLIVLGGFYLPPKPQDKIITVRLFDWKKRPISHGEVTAKFHESPSQTLPVDKNGQVLFPRIPADELMNKVKIEISSSGFIPLTIDTLVDPSKPIDLTMQFTDMIIISGFVRTAGEQNISNAEINVKGTKYATKSYPDGSYELELKEYTLGDHIELETSHHDFKDKKIPFKITSNAITDYKIYLDSAKK